MTTKEMIAITTSTAEQRIQQFTWRPWKAMLEMALTQHLPPTISSSSSSVTALDLGCGTGEMTALMQQMNPMWYVWGFDQDPQMLESARLNHPACHFGSTSVSSGNMTLESLGMSEPADLIWSSFTCQYFMQDLDRILDNWATLLKHNGILLIVETNGLFCNHRPQLSETIMAWQEMEESLRRQHNYDSNAGYIVPDIIQQSTSFDLLEAQHWSDPEFGFDGPASPQIIEAWRQRFERMKFPRLFFGHDKLQQLQQEFLDCLASQEHTTTTKLILILARKKE
jgi:SAM-dependent methyltransferase